MVTEPLTVASISNPANSNNNYNIIRNSSSSIIVVLKLFILMDVIILHPNMKCLHRRSVTILPLSSTLQVSLVLDLDFSMHFIVTPKN